MHKPAKLEFHSFGNDALTRLPCSGQVKYLQCYLTDLGAITAIEEQNYFDRDYLAEFSAFYSTSSKGYKNLCKRIHFFDIEVKRDLFRRAAGGSNQAQSRLQNAYLGFVVIRPIPTTPLGRTVLRWYPEQKPNTPRVTVPSRDYCCHIAGIKLSVHGLAWQQQDTGVGACATVGLWSMLHSSAFDDHHTIPTTADITRAAHKTASLGSRVFPSSGLAIYQITEAIKQYNLAPVVLDGELPSSNKGFGKERFSSSCAALIRSGYPVLLIGQLGNLGGHAICATGFRACPPVSCAADEIKIQDSNIQYLYIHDDNLGPNARFRINDNGLGNPITLEADSPPPLQPHQHGGSPTTGYHTFTPHQLVVAVHEDLRTSPDVLHKAGLEKAQILCSFVNSFFDCIKQSRIGITLSTRFIKLADYIGIELGRTLDGSTKELAKTRMALYEQVPPMSLHVGVVRIALDDATPLIDILYDTTDSDRNHPVFAHVTYNKVIADLIQHFCGRDNTQFGVKVSAF